MRLGIATAGFALGFGALAGAEVRERVTSAADVRAVCDAARAPRGDGRARTYVITLPAAGFALGGYDTASARVRIDAQRGFKGAGYELVLHHIAGVDTKSADPRFELAFPATSTEEADVRAAHLAGTLELALWFQAASPRDGSAVCAEVRSTRGDAVRLAIEPLAFELTRRGERIASGESARFAALGGDAAPVTAPRVVVAAPVLTDENARAPEKVRRAATALRGPLLECYKRGLAGEPALRGSFVAGVDVAADGRVKTARAEIDALGAPEVAACVLQKVKAARFPAGAGPERLSIPMQFSD